MGLAFNRMYLSKHLVRSLEDDDVRALVYGLLKGNDLVPTNIRQARDLARTLVQRESSYEELSAAWCKNTSRSPEALPGALQKVRRQPGT